MDLSALGWDLDWSAAFTAFAAAGLVPARVACEHKHACTVLAAAGEFTATCTGRLLHDATTRAHLPTTGDWVAIAPRRGETQADQHAVLPRRTQLARRVSGTRQDEQLLAANLDTLLLVEALDAAHHLGRLERFLTAAWESGAAPVIVLTKTDLHTDPVAALEVVRARAAGVPVHAVCAPTGAGLDALAPHLQPGRTVALLGPSGVGKSTLINALLGASRLDTGERREHDGRGRHTTTRRELVVAPSGALFIDTPGLRELQFHAAAAPDLDDTFADVLALAGQCRFGDCAHGAEPGCAVQAALAEGTLDPARWGSFQKLARERAWLTRREDRAAAAAVRAVWKKRSHDVRRRLRFEESL